MAGTKLNSVQYLYLSCSQGSYLELAKGSVEPRVTQSVASRYAAKGYCYLGRYCICGFSREFRDNHWGGLASELDTVYSVVNTLAEFKSVRAVQFLLEGSPVAPSVPGVDLTSPVRPQQMTRNFTRVKRKLTARPEQPCPGFLAKKGKSGWAYGRLSGPGVSW